MSKSENHSSNRPACKKEYGCKVRPQKGIDFKTNKVFINGVIQVDRYVDIFAGMKNFLVVFAALMVCIQVLNAQDNHPGLTEVDADWKVFDDGEYLPFESRDAGAKTIYIDVDFNKHAAQILKIKSRFHPSLFIEGKLFLALDEEEVSIKIDSIRPYFRTSSVQIGIHQKTISPGNLQTTFLVPVKGSNLEEVIKIPPSFFRDFVIVASIILALLLVVILYINPKLAAEYFSVSKVFSTYESDEGQSNIRTLNSTNLLFYAFFALTLALLFKIVFHFAEEKITTAWYFNGSSFIGEILQWIRLSFFILLFFLLKLFLVFCFTRLFNLREFVRTHIFNWTRITLLFVSPLLVISIAYYLLPGQRVSVYLVLFSLIWWMLAGLVIIIFSKVARRTSFSLFHIFSYLCATEIIPLLISIKLIYN